MKTHLKLCAVLAALSALLGRTFPVRAADTATAVPLAKAAADFERKLRSIGLDLHRAKFSASITLSEDERLVDRYVTKLIDTIQAETNVIAARPFLESKEEIQGSELFELLTPMPKGGSLHLHNSTAARMDWVITNGITRSNCYIFWPSDSNASRGTIRFGTAEAMQEQSDMIPASALRARLHASGKSLDDEIRYLLQMTAGPSGTTGWPRSTECYRLIGDLSTYHPVVMESLQDSFEQLCREGAPYVEVRLASTFMQDGDQRWTGTNLIQQYQIIRDRVRAKYRQFDLKLIVSASRTADQQYLTNLVKDILEIKKGFPDMIIGGDLIGEEARNSSTLDYSGVLLDASWNIPDFGLYLHDGESSWASDSNLVAAVLLEPKRIGHGFNLFRFPKLEEIVRNLDIALEICPISNQLLGFAPDLRIHPADGYLSRGIQCVLGSDDPLIFGNDGLTYDFWMAAVAWNLDLASLKKLGENAIRYSGMSTADKAEAYEFFEASWSAWISETKEKANQFLAGTKPE